MLELELKADYGDERTAKSVLLALEPDNKGYVESRLDGRTIVFKIKADDAGSMKNTADDLLACIKIAESASGLVVPTSHLDGDSLLE